MNGGRFNNWTKSIIISKTIPQFKTSGKHPCLIELNGSIEVAFDFEHPFVVNKRTSEAGAGSFADRGHRNPSHRLGIAALSL
jgi:hypothetical protein